jgi:6-phosphofructokinase 2
LSIDTILTVTLNPAIDEAISIDELVLGAADRCELDALDPGGKGINAARVLHRLGYATLALGFLGGVTGQMLRANLQSENVPHAFDEVEEPTRLNIMLYERREQRRSRIYLPGPHVDAARLEMLRTRLSAARAGSLVVFGGSVPPGLDACVYRDFARELHARGVMTIVDGSGAALKAALEARPTLIKPNIEEANEMLGCALDADAQILEAAFALRKRGARNVVISQGGDGAIGVEENGRAWKATAPKVTVRSTVGSGDSMVAGLAIALAEGKSLDEGLRWGTAAGTATAMISGTHLCRPEDVRRLVSEVTVTELSPCAT